MVWIGEAATRSMAVAKAKKAVIRICEGRVAVICVLQVFGGFDG